MSLTGSHTEDGPVNHHDLRPYVEELAIGRFKISFPLQRSCLLFLCSIRSLIMLFGACLLLMTMKTGHAILAKR